MLQKSSAPARAMRFLALVIFLTIFLPEGWAATPTPSPSPAAAASASEWLAVFEQSYGREGLYVVEIDPQDDGGHSRLNSQLLDAAVQRYQVEHPGKAVSWEALEKASLLPRLEDHPADEKFVWDEATGLFRSSLGGEHDPAAGAVLMLRANEAIRRRILRPDSFTRQRWKKIYNDSEVPQFLKREIELREFLLKNFFFPEAIEAENIQKQLARLEEVLKIYAVTEGKIVGDPVNWDDLQAGRYEEFIPSFPKGTEVKLDKIGDAPVAVYDGMEITADPASVGKIRFDHAKTVWEKYPEYPPALALRARFEDPGAAIALLTRAVSLWPDVPGLRVERMTHLARMGRIGSWSDDLDFVFRNFPAAPLLIEIQQLAETKAFTGDIDSEANFALLLADIRPDLLTHQLYAIRALEKAERLKDVRSVYDRLVYANPAWKLLLSPPGEKNAEVQESTDSATKPPAG